MNAGPKWRTPPARHTGLAPAAPQRPDTPVGALALGCFLFAFLLLTIAL